jgi:DNA-binding transcriptional LysR family regulator
MPLYVPVWHFVDSEIESGRLKVLLSDFEPPPLPISAVWPSRRLLSSKVRAAIDFFAAEFHLEKKKKKRKRLKQSRRHPRKR